MNTQLSAGILLFRQTGDAVEVLIGHPGGPFWANKQAGAWSIPKGLIDPGEEAAKGALREFAEETGHQLAPGEMIDLGEVQLRSGKRILAWAVRGSIDPAEATSNTVRLEWPRGSGRFVEFPEIDQLLWCSIDKAEVLLNPAQTKFLARLQKWLDHAK